MFDNLKDALEDQHDDINDSDEESIDESVKNCFIEAEHEDFTPSGLQAIEAFEKDIDDLEDIATVIEAHGNSKSLISFLNRDRGLENLLGKPVSDIVEMSAEDIRAQIDAIIENYEIKGYDNIINPKLTLYDDGEVENAEEGLLAKVAILGSVGLFIVTLFGAMITTTVHEIKGIRRYRDQKVNKRINTYREAIRGKKWDDEKASSTNMRTKLPADLATQAANFGKDLTQVIKAIFENDLPITEQEYKSWTSKVDSALGNFGESGLGISVNWDKKNPSVKAPGLMFLEVKDKSTAKELGYDGSTFGKFDKAVSQIYSDLTKNLVDNQRRLEMRAKQVAKKAEAAKKANDEMSKEDVKAARYYSRKAMRGGRNLHFKLVRLCGYKLGPAYVGVMGDLTRFYS